VEPFTGSAAVFLNTDYDRYLLADGNADLINLYRQLQDEGEAFLRFCRKFFTPENNEEKRYYAWRDEFNRTNDTRLKSGLFLYLNRHCYNGLCRYNARGEFNTPFGRYRRPYFPEREMRLFLIKSRRAEFVHAGFADTMNRARKGDVVYCDPPYVPLSTSANFTDYCSGGFNWDSQAELAKWAGLLSRRGIRVVISNHDTATIRELYESAGAETTHFRVRRSISCDAGNRGTAGELLAVFQPAA